LLRSRLQSVKPTVLAPSLPLAVRVPLSEERYQHEQSQGISRSPQDATSEVLVI
jgi:hypothetical protein